MESTLDSPSLASRLVSIGISESYASQLANKRRAPSLSLSLRIYRELQERMGPVAHCSDEEIAALERVNATRSQEAAA